MRKGDLVYIYNYGRVEAWFFDDRAPTFSGSILTPLSNQYKTEGGMEKYKLKFHLPREYAS